MSHPPQGPTGGGGYPPQGGGMPPQGGGYPPQGGGMPPQGQGPYAGGSYMPPPGHMPPTGAPPQKRSSIPMVVGILMIIFAGLGLLLTLIALAQGSEPSGLGGGGPDDILDTLKTFETVENLVGLGLGLFHLIAGVMAVRYKSGAPKLAMIYGWVSIVWIITKLVLVYAWIKPMLDEGPPGLGTFFGFLFVFVALFSLAWPIIVLALMSRPAAKKACVN